MKPSKVISTLIGLLLISGHVHALPVLRETAADFKGEMVTIYADHADPNLFYFLPNTSTWAKNHDKSPAVALTILDKEAQGNKTGGVLNMVLAPAITPELRNELESFRATRPNARLSVVPFGTSSVVISKNSPDKVDGFWGEFIKGIDIPPYAGVAETEVGINIALTGEGVKYMEGTIRGNASHNLYLCFAIDGTTPEMHARITLNYEEIYKHWRASAKAGWWIFSNAVSREVEKLQKNGHIKIQILGGDAAMEDYVKEVAKEMMDTYLMSELSKSPASGIVADGARPIKLTFNSTYRETRNTATFDWLKRKFITDNRCLPLSLRGLRSYADQIITNIQK